MPALEERKLPGLGERLFGDGDERTLDDVVVGVLYDASRGDSVACPVCGAPWVGLETCSNAGPAALAWSPLSGAAVVGDNARDA